MNILLYDFLNAYIQYDLVYYLLRMGHKCNNVAYRELKDKYDDDVFMSRMESDLKTDEYDLVLTTNFWPVVSKMCNRLGVKYVSWFFDSPPNLATTECMDYPCNKIYFFSRADYEAYRAIGLDNVFYLPLAVNVDRLDTLQTDYCKYESEISFVGKLYQSLIPLFKAAMDEYQRGYLDAVVSAQLLVYGAYLLDDLITEQFTEGVREKIKGFSKEYAGITCKELIWETLSYITNIERLTLLKALSDRHQVKLYTYSISDEEKNLLQKVECCGPVHYLNEMPQVFKASKINLCPVIRANKSGIPLRALDIMGAGGFLLSSYQQELYEYFVDGQDCVMYTSIEDAVEKAEYYLAHDDSRKSIAEAGKNKIRKDFKYEDRIKVLLEE